MAGTPVSPLDLDELFSAAYRRAAAALDAGTFVFALFHEESQTVEVVRQIAAGRELPGGSFPLGTGFTSEVIRTGRPRLIRQFSAERPHIQVQYATDARTLPESAAIVPILDGGRVVGVLSAQSYRIGAYDDADITTLQAIAADTAAALRELRHPDRMDAALRRRASELEAILASIADALIITDAAGAVVRLNEAARRLLQSLSDIAPVIMGQSFTPEQWGLWPAATRPVAQHLSRLAAAVGRGESVADAEIEISGTRRQVLSFSCTPLRGQAGALAGGVIAFRDVTDRRELRERDERQRQELERAAAIQRRLLPSSIKGWPGVLEIAHRFRPAVETSGDFFDVLRLAPREEGAPPPLQIAVGDVAGKGMAAALVTALARAALRSTAAVPTELATPAAALRLAGRRLNQDVGGGHFVACALAVVEPPGLHHAGPRLRLANAAQVPVLLARDGRAQEIEPPGYRLPLGAQADGDYKDAQADLRPGDAVVFSSDGLVEAPALPAATPPEHLPPPEQVGELFGFARLATSAAHWSAAAVSAEGVAAGVWSDLTAWCGEESHHDDMTLLVLRVPR